MYSGKAVEEVGQWREALGKELENISFDKRSEYLNKQGMEIYNKYNMKCPVEKKIKSNPRIIKNQLNPSDFY